MDNVRANISVSISVAENVIIFGFKMNNLDFFKEISGLSFEFDLNIRKVNKFNLRGIKNFSRWEVLNIIVISLNSELCNLNLSEN